MPLPMTWDYVAGFFDGEGCVEVHSNVARRSTGTIRVSISQSGDRGKRICKEIIDFLEARGIHSNLAKQGQGEKYKPAWKVITSGKGNTEKFLKAILPYVRVKKLETQDTWRYLKAFPSIKWKNSPRDPATGKFLKST